MKVGVVVPRYGESIAAGAEGAARSLAERLAQRPGFEVTAYTTCAINHMTWENVLAPGSSDLNGVHVERFGVDARRNRSFFTLDERLRWAPRQATREQSERWVELNGPVSSGLIGAVGNSGADVIVFSPYLFHSTIAGIRVCPSPSVLNGAAHDEAAFYLPSVADTYARADGLCFYSAAERRLAQQVYRLAGRPQIVLGLGVDSPVEGGRSGGEILGIGDRPYVVCVGRVELDKGVSVLDAFFRRYKQRRPGPLALAFVGSVVHEVPSHPDVVVTGQVDEPTKWDLLRDATALVHPSTRESFSFVIMEAWEQGIPVVVNGACAVTTEHAAHSGGGLWFSSYRQFEVVLDRLLADAQLRGRLGAAGREYVNRNFRWSVVVPRFADFLEAVAARGRIARLAHRGLSEELHEAPG
jgi:glycosyltransferase involved in cell wall biosynthesis